jgi:RNA polymerase sigma-70 factor (ECF subfamily)
VLLRLLPKRTRGAWLVVIAAALRGATRGQTIPASGEFVPLSEQDTALWSQPMLEEAERALLTASTYRRSGRFQLEAAIQSVHSHRLLTGRTEWSVIIRLYDELIRRAPTVGALVSRAGAFAGAGEFDSALQALDEIPTRAITSYQPYWAVRAHVLAQNANPQLAREAYTRAIGLTEDDAVRRFLQKRRNLLPPEFRAWEKAVDAWEIVCQETFGVRSVRQSRAVWECG